MSLPGLVESALPSVPGFDCDTVISAVVAEQFYTQGYKFCIRYVSIGQESSSDLTEQEATSILSCGLALMPVQHTRSPGWSPTRQLGLQDGGNAGANAQSVGFPPGVNLWCDLEGVGSSAQTLDIVRYCDAWFEAVAEAGYAPGVYVGAAAQLTGQQLYDLPFQHYWRSQSVVPDVPNRGYQMFQLFPSIEINGIEVDIDVANSDREGGRPQWLRMESFPLS
ncbi:MAG TPA: DUF1906 domain-containing protein [Bryobacteraceae bacterium]